MSTNTRQSPRQPRGRCKYLARCIGPNANRNTGADNEKASGDNREVQHLLFYHDLGYITALDIIRLFVIMAGFDC